MNSPNVQKAIDETFEELRAMSTQEFRRAVERTAEEKEHENTDISSPEFLRLT